MKNKILIAAACVLLLCSAFIAGVKVYENSMENKIFVKLVKMQREVLDYKDKAAKTIALREVWLAKTQSGYFENDLTERKKNADTIYLGRETLNYIEYYEKHPEEIPEIKQEERWEFFNNLQETAAEYFNALQEKQEKMHDFQKRLLDEAAEYKIPEEKAKRVRMILNPGFADKRLVKTLTKEKCADLYVSYWADIIMNARRDDVSINNWKEDFKKRYACKGPCKSDEGREERLSRAIAAIETRINAGGPYSLTGGEEYEYNTCSALDLIKI